MRFLFPYLYIIHVKCCRLRATHPKLAPVEGDLVTQGSTVDTCTGIALLLALRMSITAIAHQIARDRYTEWIDERAASHQPDRQRPPH